MAEEWGPWIEHDGNGCPCVGQYVRTRLADGLEAEHIAGGFIYNTFTGAILPRDTASTDLWVWKECLLHSKWSNRVIAYRIKKPRGLIILENLIADLPAPVMPKVDA